MKFTEKQKRFIDYFIETGNKTEAAKLAGYKAKNLAAVGHENYIKLEVFITEKLAQKDAERIASQDEVLRYLTSVMRGDGVEEVVVVESCGEGCSSATTVQKEIQPKDRIKAAELLGKRHGLFVDKAEITVDPPIVIRGGDALAD